MEPAATYGISEQVRPRDLQEESLLLFERPATHLLFSDVAGVYGRCFRLPSGEPTVRLPPIL